MTAPSGASNSISATNAMVLSGSRSRYGAIRWRSPTISGLTRSVSNAAVVGRDDEDGAVQAHLLAVVLADVWVKPVQPLVGELQPILEALADLDRALGLVRAVVAVLEAQPVPMHG